MPIKYVPVPDDKRKVSKPHGYPVGIKPALKSHQSIKEAEVLEACKEFLKKQTKVWWRRIDGSGKLFKGKLTKAEARGFPDLLIISNGMCLALEVKRPWGGTLSHEQAECICGMIKFGAAGGVITSLAGLIKALKGETPSDMIETAYGVVPLWH